MNSIVSAGMIETESSRQRFQSSRGVSFLSCIRTCFTTTSTKGWRFVTESSWTLWHPRGSRQGHPRYTSASTEEGRGWPDKQAPRDTTKTTTRPRLQRHVVQTLEYTHFECIRNVMEINPLRGNECTMTDFGFFFG